VTAGLAASSASTVNVATPTFTRSPCLSGCVFLINVPFRYVPFFQVADEGFPFSM
jgi:hypothetical protein